MPWYIVQGCIGRGEGINLLGWHWTTAHGRRSTARCCLLHII